MSIENYNTAACNRNIGRLDATGWVSFVDFPPPFFEGDQESYYITQEFVFIINNPKYSGRIYIGYMINNWRGDMKIQANNALDEELYLDIKDNPLIDDIYYKVLNLPKLEDFQDAK
jgi:hypothetical protein|tara:strand:+ start:343 stop:690 length:348 start_codon:yes stop_codon:yes gene_type:complete